MEAVVYARISKDRTGAGLGVDRQRSDCNDLAERLGWDVVETFSDNDISAYSGKTRPGYDAMMRFLEDGGAGAILAWHPDRLHRRPVELETFIDFCDTHKIEVRTAQAGDFDLSTASGKLVARMLGAAARHEVEHAIERQKRAKKQAAVDGLYRGGRRPFGWRVGGMVLDPVESGAIRTAVEGVLAGKSLRGIVIEWNAAGLKTSMGKDWTTRTLRKVLLRPRNAGLSLHDGARIPGAQWEPIVTADEFTALEHLLSDPARRTSFSVERKWQGSGIYVCGKCGLTMRTADQTRGQRAYVCNGGKHMSRVAEPLDEYVSELVIARLSKPDARLLRGGEVTNVDRLRTQRDALSGRLDELAALFADGAITGAQLKNGSEKLRTDLLDVEHQIAAARESSVLAHLLLGEDDLREQWQVLSPDLRGKVVDALMVVTILPSPRGRLPGGEYFSPEYVRVEWKV